MKAEIRKRLTDSANALERATAQRRDGAIITDAAVLDDEPEGAVIIKMSHTIRKALIKTLRDAVDDAWRDIRVTIMRGWYEEGRQGTALAQVDGVDGTNWTVVRWDESNEEDECLDLHKSSGLLAGEWA